MESLAPDDYFTIHTFSSSGTESSFGPSKATSFAIDQATDFVGKLSATGSTNLYDAYLDALDRVSTVQSMAEESQSNALVPVIMMLSDGEATEGITDRAEIARAVRNRNEGLNAKVYGLAFGMGADLPLLLGIAIQNDGRAISIYVSAASPLCSKILQPV